MLSDTTIRTAKPGHNPAKGKAVDPSKPYRMADAGGLYLEVAPTGGKLWRWKYRHAGKEKRLALGAYPDVTLKQARERRDEARKLLADGIDPGEQRKAEKVSGAQSFEAVAREWFAKFSPHWAASHADKVIRRLERDVFPWIGSRHIAALTAPDVLAVLRRIEGRNAIETAHRAMQNCGQVMRYAVATGRAQGDVTRDLRGSLAPWKPQSFASVTDPAAVGDLLRAIDSFTGTYVVGAMLRLLPLVFVRPGELREAQWSEIDLDKAEWSIPAERMKLRLPHLVPLSAQALAILRDLQPLTGSSRYVFPGARSQKKPASNMAANAALRRVGIDRSTLTAHGFRAMARTILDEILHVRPDYIEHQLAHAVRDANGRAYNRTSFLPERRAMMQQWANYLDTLKQGGNVLPMVRKAG